MTYDPQHAMVQLRQADERFDTARSDLTHAILGALPAMCREFWPTAAWIIAQPDRTDSGEPTLYVEQVFDADDKLIADRGGECADVDCSDQGLVDDKLDYLTYLALGDYEGPDAIVFRFTDTGASPEFGAVTRPVDAVDWEHVYNSYEAAVVQNMSATWDTEAAVYLDRDGEAWSEVADTAHDIGIEWPHDERGDPYIDKCHELLKRYQDDLLGRLSEERLAAQRVREGIETP